MGEVGGRVRGVGLGGQGGWERRSVACVKIQKKIGGGGWGSGGGGGVSGLGGGGVWVAVNGGEAFMKIQKKNFFLGGGVGSGGGGGRVGGVRVDGNGELIEAFVKILGWIRVGGRLVGGSGWM